MTRHPRAPRRSAVTCLSAVVAAFVSVLVPALLGAAPANAADNGAWSVTPTPPDEATAAPRDYFVLEGDPGTRIKDKVRIQNWTKEPITFKLFGADGYNTEVDGFFALRGFEDEMTDLGSWVTPVTTQVTVYGQTQVDVPVTITIPENATPGDHVGGVVAMNVDVESTQEDEGGFDVGIQRAVGARMYVRVSGPTTPALEVSDVRLEHDRGALPWTGSGKGTVTYTVENTGNLRLSPDAVVALSGLTGSIAEFDRPELVDLLPGQKATLTQPIDSVPFIGRVTTTVTLTAEEGVSDDASTLTWLLPWPGLLVLILLVGAAAWLIRRRRAAAVQGRAAAEEAPKITVSADR